MAVADEPQACRIVRHALLSYFRAGRVDMGPDIAPARLDARAAVFVSLWSGKDLRGCMGTVEPLMPTAAREIAVVALQAATGDVRRRPVHPLELDGMEIGVSVLGERRVLEDGEGPRPEEALLVDGGDGRIGLVLPGAGDDEAARRAAGIRDGAPSRRLAVAVTAFGRVPGGRG